MSDITHARQIESAPKSRGSQIPRAASFRTSPDVRAVLRHNRMQPKLKIGAVNDPAEREADAVADKVMCMPAPGPDPVTDNISPIGRSIQRLCAGCEEEFIQPKEQIGATPALSASSESAIRGLGAGAPMPASERAFFEPRFGRDFSDVRIHTNAAADTSAKSINARAYTLGNDIAFAGGEYAPGSAGGRRLMAHELTHTVQQKFGSRREVIHRAEVDTSKGCSHLADTKEDINTHVNETLSEARSKSSSPVNPKMVINHLLYKLGRNTSGGRTAIEDFASNLGSEKVDEPKRAATKYKGVDFRLWRQPFFLILNPNMRVNDICIGSDKLGHFFQQGYQYFEIFRDNKNGTAKAEEFGEETEAGTFGLSTTGVYSNADLEANRQGLKFYKELSSNPVLSFDITHFINTKWNEEVNPSFYRESVAKVVWRNLLNRKWKGKFTVSSAWEISDITVDLRVTEGGTVTGDYHFETTSGMITRGKLINGKFDLITTKVKEKTAVTGVKVDFQWNEASEKGRGFWDSVGEDKLQGKWGREGSNSDGGKWHLAVA